MVKIGTGAVSWSSKLQTLVALSTTEAEHISAVEAGKEILWMRQFMGELGYEMPGPSVLWMDNQSAIAVNKNPEHHGKMKHLSLCLFWFRDVVQEGRKKKVETRQEEVACLQQPKLQHQRRRNENVERTSETEKMSKGTQALFIVRWSSGERV